MVKRTADFFMATVEPRTQWNNIIKLLREESVNLDLCIQQKLLLTHEGEVRHLQIKISGVYY